MLILVDNRLFEANLCWPRACVHFEIWKLTFLGVYILCVCVSVYKRNTVRQKLSSCSSVCLLFTITVYIVCLLVFPHLEISVDTKHFCCQVIQVPNTHTPPSVMLRPFLLFLVVPLHTKCTSLYLCVIHFVCFRFCFPRSLQDSRLPHRGGIWAHCLC